LDFDNDGWKDVFVANGHVYPQVDKYDWGTTWAQRPLLFRNKNGKTFELLPAATDSGLAVVKSARGAAFGDLDNDGRVDVVLNNCDNTPTVLRNVTSEAGHWLSLKLIGGAKSPRDAIGATVWLTAGGQAPARRCSSAARVTARNLICGCILAWAKPRKWTSSKFAGRAARAKRCQSIWLIVC
jgi:hypothetical protein